MKLLLLVLGFTVNVIFAFPYDAPDSQTICDLMTPSHSAAPQTSASPFHLVVSKAFAEGGEIIQVEIKPDEGRSFKGFCIQAWSKENPPQVVGEFLAVEGEQTPFNFRRYGVENSNAVTHFDNKLMQNVVFDWRAPDFEGAVTFQ